MRAFGAQSMTAPLRAVLVKRPGDAFGRAFEDPAHGYRHPVDLERAQREHDAFVELLTRLGVTVHELGAENDSPDLVYTFDPMLMTDRGAIALRSGKATRIGEEAILERWTSQHGVPLLGRITSPGTVDGGDTFWLRPDLFCIGRSLRTNAAGAAQLAELVGGDTHVFDVPYGQGPAECLHLLSLLSPVAEDAAVCFLPLLPAGLFELLREVGVRIVPVPEEEFPSQAPNILAVQPGVLVMMSGNPETERALRLMGCEVHTYEAEEIGMNGSGGPTCLARPILRG
jgi:N-dimethylarginine dimethylaminohydrolase